MLFRTFDPGLIGVFGWLDAPAPAYVVAMWSFLAFAVVLAAVAVARGRSTWGLAIAVVALLIIPAIVQAASVQASGYIWQGRYALVAYVTLIALATAIAAAGPWGIRMPGRLMRRLTAWVAALVVFGQTWALFATLQRYQGAIPVDEVILHPTWTPPGGIVLWLAVVAAGTAVAAFAVIAATGDRAEADADADATIAGEGATREPEASVAP